MAIKRQGKKQIDYKTTSTRGNEKGEYILNTLGLAEIILVMIGNSMRTNCTICIIKSKW